MRTRETDGQDGALGPWGTPSRQRGRHPPHQRVEVLEFVCSTIGPSSTQVIPKFAMRKESAWALTWNFFAADTSWRMASLSVS